MMGLMKIWFRLFIALSLLCVARITVADCAIAATQTAAESIQTYESCLSTGHQMVPEIGAALTGTAFKKADYKTAVDYFSDIIEQTERAGKAHFNRSLAYLALGKERNALADLEAANSILPGYSPAHFYRGIALQDMRRYQQAADAFETAINLSSGGKALAPIYSQMAEAELSRRDRESALDSLDKAIASDPEYAQAYFSRAKIHENNDAPALAIADYTQYLEIKPDTAEAFYNRGLIYQDLRQDHLAIEDFDKAIALNPRYVRARASKGITYLWPVLPVLLILLLG